MIYFTHTDVLSLVPTPENFSYWKSIQAPAATLIMITCYKPLFRWTVTKPVD